MNRIRSTREAVVLLTMLRQQHNLEHPDEPVYGKDVAEYIGARSKSTVVNYENGNSNPSNEMLSRWLEFWGLALYIGPVPEEVKDGQEEGPADQEPAGDVPVASDADLVDAEGSSVSG